MAHILLGVTGSVAAIKTPDLFTLLRQQGHEVQIVATRAATYFFDSLALPPGAVHLDEDEWPGRAEGRKYQRDDKVLHIELRRWADLLLIAPLDANTLAKLACGLSDNCLTCVWRAWEPDRPVVLAPAMNTLMWQHPLTAQHLRQLAGLFGAAMPADVPLDEMGGWIERHCKRLRLVAPIAKTLACGDVGIGAMETVDRIAAVVAACVRED